METVLLLTSAPVIRAIARRIHTSTSVYLAAYRAVSMVTALHQMSVPVIPVSNPSSYC